MKLHGKQKECVHSLPTHRFFISRNRFRLLSSIIFSVTSLPLILPNREGFFLFGLSFPIKLCIISRLSLANSLSIPSNFLSTNTPLDLFAIYDPLHY